jgi:hypothetical protein
MMTFTFEQLFNVCTEHFDNISLEAAIAASDINGMKTSVETEDGTKYIVLSSNVGRVVFCEDGAVTISESYQPIWEVEGVKEFVSWVFFAGLPMIAINEFLIRSVTDLDAGAALFKELKQQVEEVGK